MNCEKCKNQPLRESPIFLVVEIAHAKNAATKQQN